MVTRTIAKPLAARGWDATKFVPRTEVGVVVMGEPRAQDATPDCEDSAASNLLTAMPPFSDRRITNHEN
jgi:hypothetical protein